MKRHHLVTVGVAAVALVVGMLLGGTSIRSLFVPLLLLACPLMMFFMMRGHGDGHAGGQMRPDHDARQLGDDTEARATRRP